MAATMLPSTFHELLNTRQTREVKKVREVKEVRERYWGKEEKGKGCGRVLVSPSIAPFHHHFRLFVGPGIQISRLDSRDMGAHSSVDARATDTDEDAQRPGRPARMRSNMAICTHAIVWPFQQFLHISDSSSWNKGIQYPENGGILVCGGLRLSQAISHLSTKQAALALLTVLRCVLVPLQQSSPPSEPGSYFGG
jgi:hypothetical protein